MGDFHRSPQFVVRSRANSVGRAQYNMAGKRIALEHPLESSVDLIHRNFPRHQRTVSEIRREQSLPDTPDRSRAQHGGYARDHGIDIDAGADCDFLERLAHEAIDLVLRNRENLCVDGIIMLYRQHAN